jgi:hypothetical protein
MKNKYFGDINDYFKYSLLRVFARSHVGPISVCWMLTADDNRGDGSFIKYLSDASSWDAYDPPVFRFLHKELVWKQLRSVSAMKRSRLILKARYYQHYLDDENRDMYFQNFSTTAWSKGLIFFDPDNGLEVPSVPPSRTGSCRYLYWNDVHRYFVAGYSLLIYQHFPRVNRKQYLAARAQEIFRQIPAGDVFSFRTPKVSFLCIPQDGHVLQIENVCEQVKKQWGDKFIISYYTKKASRHAY